MKKQISKNKLTFNKKAISELNDSQLIAINGGVHTSCIPIPTVISAQTGLSILTNPTRISITTTSDVQK